jgi:hypothetical protein
LLAPLTASVVASAITVKQARTVRSGQASLNVARAARTSRSVTGTATTTGQQSSISALRRTWAASSITDAAVVRQAVAHLAATLVGTTTPTAQREIVTSRRLAATTTATGFFGRVGDVTRTLTAITTSGTFLTRFTTVTKSDDTDVSAQHSNRTGRSLVGSIQSSGIAIPVRPLLMYAVSTVVNITAGLSRRPQPTRTATSITTARRGVVAQRVFTAIQTLLGRFARVRGTGIPGRRTSGTAGHLNREGPGHIDSTGPGHRT